MAKVFKDALEKVYNAVDRDEKGILLISIISSIIINFINL